MFLWGHFATTETSLSPLPLPPFHFPIFSWGFVPDVLSCREVVGEGEVLQCCNIHAEESKQKPGWSSPGQQWRKCVELSMCTRPAVGACTSKYCSKANGVAKKLCFNNPEMSVECPICYFEVSIVFRQSPYCQFYGLARSRLSSRSSNNN